jgi:hypothetical protein
MPKPLESEIPVKYLDYKPKVLDLLDLTEPAPNTLRKQFTPRFLGHIIYQLEFQKFFRKIEDILQNRRSI